MAKSQASISRRLKEMHWSKKQIVRIPLVRNSAEVMLARHQYALGVSTTMTIYYAFFSCRFHLHKRQRARFQGIRTVALAVASLNLTLLPLSRIPLDQDCSSTDAWAVQSWG